MLQLAKATSGTTTAWGGFKPHQRGGGCCSLFVLLFVIVNGEMFQTPSAGRWVLQPAVKVEVAQRKAEFQTPSAGRWVLQPMR